MQANIGVLTLTGIFMVFASIIAHAQPGSVAAPFRVQAVLLNEFDAADADQGVAVDNDHIYVVDNSMLAKYRKRDGTFVSRWQSPEALFIRHLNSCFAKRKKLWCANSNYPKTPMASSIEIFLSKDLQHSTSHSLGVMDEGSLTWFVPLGEDWLASFAHYDSKGGAGFKNHRYSSLVVFDKHWRRKGGWMLPDSVLMRMAPYASSGGALGEDGLLYLSGHDRPELYVLAKPLMGPTLIHIATVDIELKGQAIAWDVNGDRILYGIDRKRDKVKKFSLPSVSLTHAYAERF